MWTCPVCNFNNTDNFCSNCGFEHSADYTQFATLQPLPEATPSISSLQNAYRSKQVLTTCPCCGSMMSGNHCLYCHFEPASDTAAQAIAQQVVQHVWRIVDQLTDFTVDIYRYVWVPERSRLEQAAQEPLLLGHARSFFNTVAKSGEKFAQLRDAAGTELNLTLHYKYRGRQKQLACRIPTVKGTAFWELGISLDPALRLKLYLSSGDQQVSSAPIDLDLT